MIMVQKNRETVITVRCDDSLRNGAQLLADEAGQSLVEWIRRAMREKLDRDSAASAVPRDLGEVGQLRAELDRKREDELRRYEEQERRLCELEEKLYEKTQLDEAAAELKERMAALEQQLDELTKPNITQNAGRDAKIQVGR